MMLWDPPKRALIWHEIMVVCAGIRAGPVEFRDAEIRFLLFGNTGFTLFTGIGWLVSLRSNSTNFLHDKLHHKGKPICREPLNRDSERIPRPAHDRRDCGVSERIRK
jgi:hypothetical protein